MCKKILSAFLGLIICICCSAQNNKNTICPYVCCAFQKNNSPLTDPADSLIRITKRGIIIQFNKNSFAPYVIKDLHLTIQDEFDYDERINKDISSNDTTNGFVQTSIMITVMAETKDHIYVNINPKETIKFYIPADSLADDSHKSLFSGFRDKMGVMEWQYESEADSLINFDSCSYLLYHAKPGFAWQIGKDVALLTSEAILKVKGFEQPKVYIIYKNISVIDIARPEKKGIYKIPNNTDPFNTIVVIKANRKGKNYFTELRLSEIKEGKNVKVYEVGEKYFIELKNTDIKLRLF
jgi:hypothetical protein